MDTQSLGARVASFFNMNTSGGRHAAGSESAREAETDYGEAGQYAMDAAAREVESPSAWAKVPAVHSCVSLISRVASSCQPYLARRLPDKTLEEVRPNQHPLACILNKPNSYQTQFDFLVQVFTQLVLYGNCYIYVDRTAGGVKQLLVLNPWAMDVRLNEQWQKEYRYTPSEVRGGDDGWVAGVSNDGTGVSVFRGGAGTPYTKITGALAVADGDTFGDLQARPLPGLPGQQTLDARDIIHVKGFSADGLTGVSTVARFQRTFGMMAGLDYMSAKFVSSSGAQPGLYVLEDNLHENKRKLLEKALNRPPKWGMRSLVVPAKGQWVNLGMNPRDMQMREIHEGLIKEVWRVFGIPSGALGDAVEGVPNRSLEEQNRQFLQTCIFPLQATVGQAVRVGVVPNWNERDRKVEIVWDTNELTRALTKERAEAQKIYLETGTKNVNEVRDQEKLPPREGGDEYVRGLGGGPLTDAGQAPVTREDDEDQG